MGKYHAVIGRELSFDGTRLGTDEEDDGNGKERQREGRKELRG